MLFKRLKKRLDAAERELIALREELNRSRAEPVPKGDCPDYAALIDEWVNGGKSS